MQLGKIIGPASILYSRRTSRECSRTDWFKQLEAKSGEEYDRERAALVTEVTLTCRAEREKRVRRQQQQDLEIEAMLEGTPS